MRGVEQVTNQASTHCNINYLLLGRLLIRTISYIVRFIGFQFCPQSRRLKSWQSDRRRSSPSRFDLEAFPHQIFDAPVEHVQDLLLVLTALLIDRISPQVIKGDWIVEEWEKIRHGANTAGDPVCFDASGSDSERTGPFRG